MSALGAKRTTQSWITLIACRLMTQSGHFADSVRAPIYKQRLASFAVADSTSHSNSWTEDARVKGLVLFKERVLAGEGELAWDLRRSHSVPPALTDFDKVPRYTASRP